MREKGIEIIDIDYGIKQVIESELTKLPEEFTVLIIVKPNNYEKVVLGFMDILLNEKKLFGTYITTNKPFRKILENFLKNGIKAENLFFVDCVTKEREPAGERGIKVFSSQNVTEITVLLDKAIKSKQHGGEFIFLDSVSTLLVYNDEKTVEKFVHALLERIYHWKTKGIFVTVETRGNEITIENLALFFDKTIRMQ